MKKTMKLYAFGRQLLCQSYSPHSPSYIVTRLYYVNSGSAVVSYSKKEHNLVAGNLYLLPQCSDYRIVKAENFDHTSFDFKTPLTLELDSFTEISGEKFAIKDFFSFFNNLIRDNQLCIKTAQQFCISFLLHLEQHYTFPYLTNTHILKAIEKIHENPANTTVLSLSNYLNLNKNYFIRLFTSIVGIPPMKYIRTARLSESIYMLKSGSPIYTVSEYCGYNSPSAFWKAFRKEFGYSPSKIKLPSQKQSERTSNEPDKNLYRIIHIYSPSELKPLS